MPSPSTLRMLEVVSKTGILVRQRGSEKPRICLKSFMNRPLKHLQCPKSILKPVVVVVVVVWQLAVLRAVAFGQG